MDSEFCFTNLHRLSLRRNVHLPTKRRVYYITVGSVLCYSYQYGLSNMKTILVCKYLVGIVFILQISRVSNVESKHRLLDKYYRLFEKVMKLYLKSLKYVPRYMMLVPVHETMIQSHMGRYKLSGQISDDNLYQSLEALDNITQMVQMQ